MCGDIREKAQEYYRIPSILTQKAPEVSRNCAICGFSDSPSLKVEPRLYFKIDLKLIFKNFPPCICRSANTVLRKPQCNDFADHIIAAQTPAFFETSCGGTALLRTLLYKLSFTFLVYAHFGIFRPDIFYSA